MKVGKTFRQRGQQYECVDRFEYERPATWIWIYRLRSTCPDCNRPFTCTASKSQWKKNQISRRCERCRAPGRPVDVSKGASPKRSGKPKISPLAAKLLEVLRSAIGTEDAVIPLATWKAHCIACGLIGPAKNSARASFSKYKRKLVAAGLISCTRTTVKLI